MRQLAGRRRSRTRESTRSREDAVAEEGVIYVAMGGRFVAEAVLSAVSVRRHMPSLPITLFTDSPPVGERAFDQVVEISRSGPRPHRDKLVGMLRSPYERTLFLDTDTFLGADVSPLFGTLADYDLLASLDRGYHDRYPEGSGVPDAFREFNLGVVFYRRSSAMLQSLERSLVLYDRPEMRDGNDQPPFRLATYGSELKVVVLTSEYNCRFANFGHLSGEVKVLHGRIPRADNTEAALAAVLARINRSTVPRVFVAGRVYALAQNRVRFGRPYYPQRVASLFPSSLPYNFKALRRRLRGWA